MPTVPTEARSGSTEEAPLVSPSGRPRADDRPLRRPALGYGNLCAFCRHSWPFHRGYGACKLAGCNCPAFKFGKWVGKGGQV